MECFFWIWFVGFIFSMLYSTHLFAKTNEKICIFTHTINFIFSLYSWLYLFACFIGFKIKNNV